MKGDGVRVLIVDSFYDVDFSTSRPVGSKHPEGWPDAAAGWHVLDVCDEKPFPCNASITKHLWLIDQAILPNAWLLLNLTDSRPPVGW
jgi:hypothetical protein